MYPKCIKAHGTVHNSRVKTWEIFLEPHEQLFCWHETKSPKTRCFPWPFAIFVKLNLQICLIVDLHEEYLHAFLKRTAFLGLERKGGGKEGAGLPASCRLQFQPQIPSTRQQPLTNSHCQNAHLSKVISFVKSFYGANKTLKLLTHEGSGMALTICSR